MRPDRIVVGECRGGEALDMLQAMNTGHDGSITTVHSNSPRDTLSRIETMTLMAGFDLPVRAIREQMASALDLIVHLTRLRDGTRRITHVTEVQGMEGDVITLQDIFLFDYGMGVDEDGRFQRPPQGHRRPAEVRREARRPRHPPRPRGVPARGLRTKGIEPLMRTSFRFRDLRFAALVVLVISLFAAFTGAARADDDKRLVIRSVDALSYPETKVVVLPVGPAPSPASYELEENGAAVSAVQAASLTDAGVGVGIVYVVDTSVAMGKQEAMDKVKAALTEAVAKRTPNQQIAIRELRRHRACRLELHD